MLGACYPEPRIRAPSLLRTVLGCPVPKPLAFDGFREQRRGMQVGRAAVFTVVLRPNPAQTRDFPANAGLSLTSVRPLARNVSTIVRWQARPDDGEHSGR